MQRGVWGGSFSRCCFVRFCISADGFALIWKTKCFNPEMTWTLLGFTDLFSSKTSRFYWRVRDFWFGLLVVLDPIWKQRENVLFYEDLSWFHVVRVTKRALVFNLSVFLLDHSGMRLWSCWIFFRSECTALPYREEKKSKDHSFKTSCLFLAFEVTKQRI